MFSVIIDLPNFWHLSINILKCLQILINDVGVLNIILIIEYAPFDKTWPLNLA